MYAGVAALTTLLGVPEACERIVSRDDSSAYFFRTGARTLAIAWRTGEGNKLLKPVAGVTVRDLMGNQVGVDVRPFAAKSRGTVEVCEFPKESGSPIQVTVRH